LKPFIMGYSPGHEQIFHVRRFGSSRFGFLFLIRLKEWDVIVGRTYFPFGFREAQELVKPRKVFLILRDKSSLIKPSYTCILILIGRPVHVEFEKHVRHIVGIGYY